MLPLMITHTGGQAVMYGSRLGQLEVKHELHAARADPCYAQQTQLWAAAHSYPQQDINCILSMNAGKAAFATCPMTTCLPWLQHVPA